MVIDKILGGRPPLLFPDSELDNLGTELLDWLEKEGKDKSYFVYWYFDIKGMSRKDWNHLTKREGFRSYYEIARQKMSHNMMNGDLDKGFTHRYLGIYDDELRAHEKEIKVEEAAINSKEQNDFMELASNLQKMSEFFDRVRSMQTSGSTEVAKDRSEIRDK
jgi:hypothetical protein